MKSESIKIEVFNRKITQYELLMTFLKTRVLQCNFNFIIFLLFLLFLATYVFWVSVVRAILSIC